MPIRTFNMFMMSVEQATSKKKKYINNILKRLTEKEMIHHIKYFLS